MDLQPAAPLRHPVLRQDVVARFMRKLGVEQTSLGRPELEEARIQQFIRKRFPFHFTPQTIQRMFHEADSKGGGSSSRARSPPPSPACTSTGSTTTSG